MTPFKQLASAVTLATLMAAPAMAAPVTYMVDASHTFARFSYVHFGYSTQLSSFSKTSGKVVFDADARTGSVDIVIDTKSVNTGSTDFNEHIQGEDFLDTGKFPQATFKSTKVVFDGPKPSQIECDFIPGHASPDDEKTSLGRQCLHDHQADRFQGRKVRTVCR